MLEKFVWRLWFSFFPMKLDVDLSWFINLKQLCTVGNLAANLHQELLFVGSAFQRESIFAGSNTAVHARMQHFHHQFQDFCHSSWHPRNPLQSTRISWGNCTGYIRLLQALEHVVKNKRPAQQVVLRGGMAVTMILGTVCCPNLCDCRILRICMSSAG